MQVDISHFGKVSNEYAAGRKGYPNATFQKLLEYTNAHALILDLGCGTGISTREMKEKGLRVVGIDKEEAMLKKARGDKQVSYVRGIIQKLPFRSSFFDVISAYSSFHWFTTKQEINEIKRVLKKGGILFIVNKSDVDSFVNNFIDILEKECRKTIPSFVIPDVKKGYNPQKIIKENGLKIVERCDIRAKEIFSLKECLLFLCSTSFWTYVPEEKKSSILRKVRDYYKKREKNNKVVRNIIVQVVIARKDIN